MAWGQTENSNNELNAENGPDFNPNEYFLNPENGTINYPVNGHTLESKIQAKTYSLYGINHRGGGGPEKGHKTVQ